MAAHNAALRLAARSLSDRNRTVMLLRYASGLSVPQIAAVLGITEQAVALALAEVWFRFQPLARGSGPGAFPP